MNATIEISTYRVSQSVRWYVPFRMEHSDTPSGKAGRALAVTAALLLHAWMGHLLTSLTPPGQRTTAAIAGSASSRPITAFIVADRPARPPPTLSPDVTLQRAVPNLLLGGLPASRIRWPDDLLAAAQPQSPLSTALVAPPAPTAAERRMLELTEFAARIDRAWMRPPPHLMQLLTEDCIASLRHGSEGEILAVDLGGCPEEPGLRRSLVAAIRNAGPFPLGHPVNASAPALQVIFAVPPLVRSATDPP